MLLERGGRRAAAWGQTVDGRTRWYEPRRPVPPPETAGPEGSEPGQTDILASQGTVSTSGPSSVTAIVCSKWADRRPSPVTTLQPSPSSRVPAPPALTMGSTAKTLPDLSLGPGLPGQWLGTGGSSCLAVPMAGPTS